MPDAPKTTDSDWVKSVKAYYRDVESYDWVDVADNFRGLEAFFHRWRERVIRRLRPDGEALRFLDAGCGTGLNLRHLPEGSVGVDLNGRSLTVVRRRLQGYSLVHADVEGLPFAAASFDVVLCTEVLEHVPDPEMALREILRVLKPGGSLIGSVPSRSPIWKLRFLSSTCPHQEPFHNQYSKRQVRSLLGGYEIRFVKHALAGSNVVFDVGPRPSGR